VENESIDKVIMYSRTDEAEYGLCHINRNEKKQIYFIPPHFAKGNKTILIAQPSLQGLL
jgi:hypothetical protein